MVFIQKRIDKKIVFWTTNLQPTNYINHAARYNGFDSVSSSDLSVIRTWIHDERTRANFNTVIVPICVDEDTVEPNELGERQEPTTTYNHYRMTENIKTSLNRPTIGFDITDYIDFTTDTDLVRRVQKMEKNKKEECIPR
jgi:hypothetical protein